MLASSYLAKTCHVNIFVNIYMIKFKKMKTYMCSQTVMSMVSTCATAAESRAYIAKMQQIIDDYMLIDDVAEFAHPDDIPALIQHMFHIMKEAEKDEFVSMLVDDMKNTISVLQENLADAKMDS